jgi:hypothetical protein
MESFLKGMVIIFTALTFLIFLTGVGGMVRNNNFYKKHSNFLMRLRVIFQGITLAAFALLLMMR